jgi:hypothetical protein
MCSCAPRRLCAVEAQRPAATLPSRAHKATTEDLAAQVERTNLTATILKDLVRPDGTFHDLIEILGRLAFAVNLDIALELHRGAEHFEGTG